MSSAPAAISLRPAQPADCQSLARLLVQLYHAETPGALRGPAESQHAFVYAMLQRGGLGGWSGRYMALGPDGSVVGTAGLHLPGQIQPGVVPSGTLRLARRLLGTANALRLFGSMLRSLFSSDTALPPLTAYIHSVVVDERARGRGVGQALLAELERIAAERGMRAVQLRVIVGNTPAQRLYLRQGYRTVGRTPAWLAWLTFPTELMVKLLPAAAPESPVL